MEKTNNQVAQVVGALLIGSAIGGILGILFAPAKGSDTRKQISSTSDDLTNSMKDKFNEFLDDMKTEATKIKKRTSDIVHDGVLKS